MSFERMTTNTRWNERLLEADWLLTQDENDETDWLTQDVMMLILEDI